MKKIISLMVVCLLSVTMLAGCTTSKAMKDGTYKAEYSAPDDHGWTEFVEVTVKDDKITDVVFDGKNTEGKLKSTDPDYEAAMKNSGSKTWPSDFYTKLTAQLVEKQKIDDVDTVAGATTSSNDFKKLVKALSSKMSKGDTAIEKVTR